MKRLLFFILVFSFSTSYQKTGEEGQPCLNGKNCSSGELICNQKGICIHCGNQGEPCCSGAQQCAEGFACSKEKICSCGEWEEPCCEGDWCNENPGSFPEIACSVSNTCGHCGGYKDLCYKDRSCQDSFICNQEGYCDYGEIELCGTLMLPEPCDGSICLGWLVLAEEINQWIEPFGWNFNADESICESFSVTTTNSTAVEESSDWCYRYVAYWKQDILICDHIIWKSIKEKCLVLDNPDDYYVLPFINF